MQKNLRIIIALFAFGALVSALRLSDTWAAPEITVSGNVTLTINSAVAGQNLSPVTDTTSSLTWTKDTCIKITVQTNLASPDYVLKVEATSVTGGTSAGEITITTSAQKIVDVTGDGSCTLEYTHSANAQDGAGTDNHTITYTITD